MNGMCVKWESYKGNGNEKNSCSYNQKKDIWNLRDTQWERGLREFYTHMTYLAFTELNQKQDAKRGK